MKMRVELRGKRWNLEVVEYLYNNDCGNMDPAGVPGKRIRISRSQDPLAMLDTIIHECLHAAVPDLAESTVEESATDIARVLYRMGYRLKA